MPIPGLTDIYQFSDWLKKNYLGPKRVPFTVHPVQGGLILCDFESLSTTEVKGVTVTKMGELIDIGEARKAFEKACWDPDEEEGPHAS